MTILVQQMCNAIWVVMLMLTEMKELFTNDDGTSNGKLLQDS